MSKGRRIKKIIGGVEVDSHTTLEAAGPPIFFLIRRGSGQMPHAQPVKKMVVVWKSTHTPP